MHLRTHSRFSLLAGLALLAGSACTSGPQADPSLVVFVVVDQLRGDLLERYDSLFDGGFRRLHDEGFRFLEATHDHAKTATAPGHATLSTGVFPSRHGIVGNEWFERRRGEWRRVYSVEDTLSHVLGVPVLEGRSPENLLRGGLADWVLSADSGALVASASRKDRAAITMSGKTRGHTYWIPEQEGRWVTSSFYAVEYPDWVDRLNRDEMPRIFGDSIWEETIDPAMRGASRPDTADYEGDGVHTYFPHRFSLESPDPEGPKALNVWAYGQTYPDEAVGIFAQRAVTALGLGEDEVTDYLALSFSQTDAIGHDYGPLSREQLENLHHLDRVLGNIMSFLDAEVGKGRWVMALTADHGTLTIPEYPPAAETGAARTTRQDLQEVRSLFEAYTVLEGDPRLIQDSLVADLERLPFVGDALSVTELTTPPPADSFVVLMRNSYHPDRWITGYGSEGSGVVFRFTEGLYPTSDPRGTGHGSPYYYDRHVPLVFYGAGVAPGISREPVRSVDIAPTLAELAGIPTPPDLDGHPLLR